MKFNEYYGDKIALTYDDVCLVPQYSTVTSRANVGLTHGKLALEVPIISSNMDTVTEARMALAMRKNGGLGIIHRFMSSEKLEDEIHKYYKELFEYDTTGNTAFNSLALSVGTNDQSYSDLEYCLKKARIICIDIAHGDSEHVLSLIKHIRKIETKTHIIIAGNVATPHAAERLAACGTNIIKVGIGPGSMCSTRIVTGHGVPQLSAVDACAQIKDEYDIEIIADGGIRKAGDIAKAYGAGADYVMLGSMLAATDESPGDVVVINKEKYKQYRGMASFDAQAAIGKDKKKIVPEGASQFKKCIGSVDDILFQLAGGVRSALSYSGFHSLSDFIGNGEFIRISSASKVEGEPHGLVER